MPDGKNHNLINTTVLIIILAGLYAFFDRSDLILPMQPDLQLISIFSISYLFGTFFLSPDLDIDSAPYEKWGIFKILWWPYKVIFKHRGLSHHPVFGPISILFNFGLILLPVVILGGIDIYLIPVNVMAAILTGILLPIEIHILADMVVSKLN